MTPSTQRPPTSKNGPPTPHFLAAATMMLSVPLRWSAVLVRSSRQYYSSLGSFRCIHGEKGQLVEPKYRQQWGNIIPTTTSNTSILRSFSTSSSSEKTTSTPQKEKEEPIEWLFQRTPNTMMKPRVILGLASFHTLYWTWYVVDFMPAVNASPLEHLHIDPVVGLVGMFFSIFANFGAALYPWSLVSGMGLKGRELCVFAHTLPTMRPAEKGVVYEIGDVCMDPSTEETKKIVEKLKGDIGSYRGIVALKANRRRLPYLLQIEDSNEVLDSWLLLQVLVNPGLAKKELQRSDAEVGEKPKQSGGRRAVKTARGQKRRVRR